MRGSARFRFYGSLNDFLPRSKRNNWIELTFNNLPSVKDSIEAIGIPHVEVDVILSNNCPVHFRYIVQPNDHLEVYPIKDHWPGGYSLADIHAFNHKFVLDVHLGRLARELRLLGFDCIYDNQYSDPAIVQIVVQENRALLTRDIGLLKHKVLKYGYWLRSQDPKKQLMEVINYFDLSKLFKPFTRCIACNGMIEPVEKQFIIKKLPSGTINYYNEFYQCNNCKRVYWKGSHYERLVLFIEQVKEIMNRQS
jgi:hypothetical protein